MDVIAAGGRAGSLRARPWFLVLVASLAAAAAYALMRADGGRAVRASYGYVCNRLLMEPGDWPCRVRDAHTVSAYVVGSLTIGLGLSIPCAVLASTGRRLTAILPLAVPVTVAGLWSMTSSLWYMEPHAFGSPYLGMWPTFGWRQPTTYWFVHTASATLADLALLAVPAAAIILIARPRRDRSEPAVRWTVTLAALIGCAAASAAMLWVSALVANQLWPNEFGFAVTEPGAWVVPALAMGTFGFLLGPNRKWWPWIHAPVAVLLSGATMIALMSSVERFWNLSGYGAAIPYFGIALICSYARPLAERLSSRGPATWIDLPESHHAAARKIRPRVALGTGAASILLISAFAFLFDPAPAHYSAALPTYLGERTYVQDLRAKDNLRDALAAVHTYRGAHGTLDGFDAATAAATAPGAVLAWTDGIPVTAGAGGLDDPVLQVGIVKASGQQAEFVALSASGTAFCVRERGRHATYGASPGAQTPGTAPTASGAFAAAVAACGSAPWSSASLRPFPVGALCEASTTSRSPSVARSSTC
jgi:hypothetical protein